MALNLDKQRNRINEAYLHYPNIPSGYLGIKVNHEGIKQFNILKNLRKIRIPLQYKFIGSEKIYRIYITGFEYTTESPYTVDKIVISAKNTQTDAQYEIFYKDTITEIENDEPVIKSTIKSGGYKFEMNSTTEWKEKYIQDKSGICVGDFGYTDGNKYKDIIESEDNYTQHIISSEAPGVFTLEGIHDSWDANFHTGLCFFELKDTNNVWVKITVDYYSEYGKLGTYELVYNPYLNDEVGILGECILSPTDAQTQYYTQSPLEINSVNEKDYVKPYIILDAINNDNDLFLQGDPSVNILTFQKSSDLTDLQNLNGLRSPEQEFIAAEYTSGQGLDYSEINYRSYQLGKEVVYNKTATTNNLSDSNGYLPSWKYWYMGNGTIVEHGNIYSYINDVNKFITRHNKDFKVYDNFIDSTREGHFDNYKTFKTGQPKTYDVQNVNKDNTSQDKNNGKTYLYHYDGLPYYCEGISLKIKDYSYLNSEAYSLDFVFFSHDDEGHGCIFSDQISEYSLETVPGIFWDEVLSSSSAYGHTLDSYIPLKGIFDDSRYTSIFEAETYIDNKPYNQFLRQLPTHGPDSYRIAYEGWANQNAGGKDDVDHLYNAVLSHGGQILGGEYDANGQLIGDSGTRERGNFISDYIKDFTPRQEHAPKITVWAYGFDEAGINYIDSFYEVSTWNPGTSFSDNYFGGNKQIYVSQTGLRHLVQDTYYAIGTRHGFPQNTNPKFYITPHPTDDHFSLKWSFSAGIDEYYDDSNNKVSGVPTVGLDIPSQIMNRIHHEKTDTSSKEVNGNTYYNCYLYNTYPDEARTKIRLFHNYKLILNTKSSDPNDFINRFPNEGGKLVLQTDLRWKYDADDGSTRYAKAGINGNEDVTISNLLINEDNYSGDLHPKNFLLNYGNEQDDITDIDYTIEPNDKYLFSAYIDDNSNTWINPEGGNYHYIETSSIQTDGYQEFITIKNGYKCVDNNKNIKLMGPAIYVFNINAFEVSDDAEISLTFKTLDNQEIIKKTTLVKSNYIKNNSVDNYSSVIKKQDQDSIILDLEGKDNYFLPVVFCVNSTTVYLEKIEFTSSSEDVCNMVNFGIYQINLTEFNTIEKQNCKQWIQNIIEPIEFLEDILKDDDADWNFRNYVILQSVINTREINVPVLNKTFNLRFLPRYSYQIPLFRKYQKNSNSEAEIAIYSCDIDQNVVEFQNNTEYTYEIDYIGGFTQDAKIKIKS